LLFSFFIFIAAAVIEAAAAATVVGPASSFHLTKVRGRKSQAVHRKTYSQLHVILRKLQTNKSRTINPKLRDKES